MADLLGSRIAGGNTAYKSVESDFYPTPSEVTDALMNFLMLPCDQKIWEPACGENHMVDAIRRRGFEVIGTDINMGVDFLSAEVPKGVDWIVTNPPFTIAESFIRKCLEHQLPFALLLKSQYWHAKKRLGLFREHPPAYVLPLTWRPDFLFGQRGGGSPLMDVMWCVWIPGATERTEYIPLSKPNVMNHDHVEASKLALEDLKLLTSWEVPSKEGTKVDKENENHG